MRLGLTGGIASGKSLVTAEFKRKGAYVVDADLISREVTGPGSKAYDGIVAEFGKEILTREGEIDRARLGQIVFADPDKLRVLNRITHPEIRDRVRASIRELEKEHDGATIVVDAALLIETGLYREMDRVVVVFADEEKQIERMKRRDGLDETEAKTRLGTQMPLERKLDYADYTIDNNETEEEAIKRAGALFDELGAGPV